MINLPQFKQVFLMYCGDSLVVDPKGIGAVEIRFTRTIIVLQFKHLLLTCCGEKAGHTHTMVALEGVGAVEIRWTRR